MDLASGWLRVQTGCLFRPQMGSVVRDELIALFTLSTPGSKGLEGVPCSATFQVRRMLAVVPRAWATSLGGQARVVCCLPLSWGCPLQLGSHQGGARVHVQCPRGHCPVVRSCQHPSRPCCPLARESVLWGGSENAHSDSAMSPKELAHEGESGES